MAVFHVVFVLNMELIDFNEGVYVNVCVFMLQCVGININFVSAPCC